MKKMKNLLLLATSTMLLASCGGNSSDDTNASSDKNDAYFYNLLCDTSNTIYYAIRNSYTVTSNGYTYASGLSSKTVYNGTDEDGEEVHLKAFIGSDTYVSNLEDNMEKTTTSYQIYYSPTKTYKQAEDGNWSITAEEHTDFNMFYHGLDYTKVANYSGSQSGYNYVLTGSIDSANFSSFINGEISLDVSSATNCKFTTSINYSADFISKNVVTFDIGDYSYSITWTYTTTVVVLDYPA